MPQLARGQKVKEKLKALSWRIFRCGNLLSETFVNEGVHIEKKYIFVMLNNSELKIRIPLDMKQRAQAAAKAKGTTVSKEVRKLLKINLLNEVA